jgi:hypothetical protein
VRLDKAAGAQAKFREPLPTCTQVREPGTSAYPLCQPYLDLRLPSQRGGEADRRGRCNFGYHTRDGYSLWLAEPGEAIALFRDREQRHEEKLLEYENIRAWMEKEWGEDVRWADSPHFASYVALQCGIIYERGYVEWCRWVAERLAEGPRTKPKAV